MTAVLIGIAKHASHQYVETDATHKNVLPRITDTRIDPWSMEIQLFPGGFLKVPKNVQTVFFSKRGISKSQFDGPFLPHFVP